MNEIPSSKLCECGCGNITPLAPKTVTARGIVKGQPLKFIHGHNRRKSGVEYLIDPQTGCWIWQRAKAYSRRGYGVSYDGKKPRDAHLVVWERANGPVPPGMELHHLCRNPPCVNPAHLEPMPRDEHRAETRRTSEYNRSRLTAEEVREIRAAPSGYGTSRALALKYGVTDSIICDVRQGRTYKQVD